MAMNESMAEEKVKSVKFCKVLSNLDFGDVSDSYVFLLEYQQ